MADKPLRRRGAGVSPRRKPGAQTAHAIISTPLVRQFREQLNEAQCEAFDKLKVADCDPARLVDYVCSLKLALEDSVELRKDPKRMCYATLRSLTAKMETAAKVVEGLYHSYFGRQILKHVRAREIDKDRARIEAEFWNIPQRLRSLAREARDVHRGTQRGRGRLYDDSLANLSVYVERATRQPHNLEVSILMNYAHGTPENPSAEYTENDLSVWKNKHRPALDRQTSPPVLNFAAKTCSSAKSVLTRLCAILRAWTAQTAHHEES